MLTLLRRIRKTLIDSGNARKYIVYAIFEVALVVIGILIALQINNWNDDRIKKIQEKEIVKILFDELEANAGYIENRIDEFEKRLFRARELMSLTGSEAKSIHPDSLGNHTARVFIMGTFSPYKMNLTRIIHSEEFNLIRYDSLRSMLGEYEILLDRSNQLYESVSSQKSHWELIDHQILTLESFRQASIKYNFKGLYNTSELSFENNTKDILANPKFAAALAHEINTFEFFIRRTLQLREDIEYLRNFISKHYDLN